MVRPKRSCSMAIVLLSLVMSAMCVANDLLYDWHAAMTLRPMVDARCALVEGILRCIIKEFFKVD